MKMLRVEWIDSGMHIADGWKPVTAALANWKFDSMRMVTVGLWAMEDDDVLVVGLSVNPATNDFFGLQIIAKQNIVKCEVL